MTHQRHEAATADPQRSSSRSGGTEIKPLNVLSLFAGIEGIGLGLEAAGMKVAGQVEINPASRAVLEKHYPEVPRHDDVRTAAAWWRSVPRPRVDVICGGFPCQPFSDAGLRLGVGDDRWGWPWFADVIRALRPRYVLVENVPAILRFPGAWDTVLGDLAAFGFDAEWSVLSACALGASHARERVFLVAYPSGANVTGQGPFPGTPRGVRAEPRGSRRDQAWIQRGWLPEPSVDRMAHGLPIGMVRDQLHALGDAVVPLVAEYVGRLIVNHAAQERNEAPSDGSAVNEDSDPGSAA